MSGWQFGGWPPPPPAADGALLALGAPNYRSSVQSVAAAGLATIPGPAAGMLRSVFAQCTAVAATTVSAVLQPSATQLARSNAVVATGLTTILSPRPWVIAAGESIEVTNPGGNAFSLFVAYYDFPASRRFPFRGAADVTPTVIVPAAPTGFYNKILQGRFENTAALTGGQNALFLFQDDTVNAEVCFYLGAGLLFRGASVGPATALSVATGLTETVVTTTPISIGTRVAVTTRGLAYAGIYETFEGVP